MLTSLHLGAPAPPSHPCPEAPAAPSALQLCLGFPSVRGRIPRVLGQGSAGRRPTGQQTLSVLRSSFRPRARSSFPPPCPRPPLPPRPCVLPGIRVRCPGAPASPLPHAPSVHPEPGAQPGARLVHGGPGLGSKPFAAPHGRQGGLQPALGSEASFAAWLSLPHAPPPFRALGLLPPQPVLRPSLPALPAVLFRWHSALAPWPAHLSRPRAFRPRRGGLSCVPCSAQLSTRMPTAQPASPGGGAPGEACPMCCPRQRAAPW